MGVGGAAVFLDRVKNRHSQMDGRIQHYTDHYTFDLDEGTRIGFLTKCCFTDLKEVDAVSQAASSVCVPQN